MEMVQTKVIAFASAALLLCSCGPGFSWEAFRMDGHRTGVTAPYATNVPEALGTVENGIYTAPNGAVFDGGAAAATAADMIAVQPRLASLKEVVAYAPRTMTRDGDETELTNFLVDNLMAEVAKASGKKVDVGVMNFGGIRVDIPQGDVILEDIVSMLPFNNYPCLVTLKGEDLLTTFEFMASTMPQVLGGVEFEVENNRIKKILIGGEALDKEKYYRVATIDFLLDGGDGLKLGRNAKDLFIMKEKLSDVILPCIRRLTEEGKPLEYKTDGRVKFTGTRTWPS